MRQDAGGGFLIIILCCFLLVCVPNRHLLLASPSSSSFSCHPDQRQALLRFIHTFSITHSYSQDASYPKVDSWREGEDCCSWHGVTCDNSTGDIIGLDLTSAGLRGSINSTSPLFSLRHLRNLSLAGNDLLGSAIPPEIGMFTRLEYLDLSSSRLLGILPMEISRLSKLISLDLSYNYGLVAQDHTIKMLVTNLTQMEELDLGYVDLSMVVPASLMNLSSSLISLRCIYCFLRGKFPEVIFGLPNLQEINLNVNYDLAGTLPRSNWSPKFDYLSLVGCSFAGTIPNSIGNLSRLTHLDISYNNFTGEFDLGILSTVEHLHVLGLSGITVTWNDADHVLSFPQLQELSMGGCELSKFPSFLSRSKQLRSLDLRRNKIQEIPSWLWSIINTDTLEELVLGYNIIRSIPPSLCRLTSLSRLDLSRNSLRGVIPQCLGNLTELQYLSLSYNSLSGPLPPSMANYTSLEYFDVSYNNISGDPPTWLSMASIYEINLRDNNFVGRWPANNFLRSTWLYSVDLSDNLFEGPLPVPSAATFYYLASDNHFVEMPSLICNATNLRVLDLSNNGIMGTLPDCLQNITAGLRYLNLHANEVGGQIPEIFYKGSRLMSLDLSRNYFEGPLPRSLSNCEQLGALDVGNNDIVDLFPSWLGDLPLKVLSLRYNNFHGQVTITKGTHSFSQVCILDLSSNNFEGNVSDEFIGQLPGMTRYYNFNISGQYMGSYNGSLTYYSAMIDLKGVETEMAKINVRFALLDLSNNHFHGEISKSIGLLISLKGLNFSHNHFTGTIPPSVGNMTNLESLDLSSNHLMGEIPKELVKLSSLGFLDLSNNNLTGPIPLGGHFNTFSNSSFEGNPGLCGIPLTRSCGQGVQPPSEGKDGGEESGGWLEWKYVAMGFGSGMGMGISLGYMVLEMGRPLWLVRLVMRLEASYRKMSKRKKGDQRRNGPR